MKITIISDNTIYNKELRSEWGFSCLVEIENLPKILFDTGASGEVLLGNMEKLKIRSEEITVIFISHDHWDHTGGLSSFLKINNRIKLYVPESFSSHPEVKEFIKVRDSIEIFDNVFSTGELLGIEQSLIVKLRKEVVVIVGCSHPGVKNILKEASKFGRVIALIGGLHGFREFDLVKNLDFICATHCTQYREEIRRLYPGKFIEGGSGKLIKIEKIE
ncbi:MAG: MBL fold metallo-hydrolase [Candidatus Omnitrophica bacterium]|nr:MBL fold metallo-hydrolase [Candidatus Omnitrophota bacterium]